MTKTRIIIVGGGFGGVKCAETLSRKLPAETGEIVLFNRENHLVFSPLLAEVVGSSIEPIDVIVPLRQLLPKVFCRTEEVRGMDLAAKEVEYVGEDGCIARMHYDHLVIACGNVTNLNVVPGMADHSFPLKTVADAFNLRSHIMEAMEQAEVASSPERRRWHLTFLVVGAGFSGSEVAGEINDLVHSSARYFRNWRPEEIRVILIHARDQILPEISPGLREFARKKMEKAGVTMLLNARVTSATPEGVALADGQVLKGGTIVCTIGNSPAPVVTELVKSYKLPAPADSAARPVQVMEERGRLVTEADMRLRGATNVWAIGDGAFVVNAENRQPSPTTGQFAERQGRQCAENILRSMRGKPTRPFTFKQLGELCSIGGHSAVADLFGFHLSGFLAWFFWRGVYLFKLPSWGRRVQVGFDWAFLLVFPRDLAHIRTQHTDRVTHAHYDPGEFIIQRGEPPRSFYVLEQGEVEVLRNTNGSDGQVVAVLGAGSFFGERALMGNRPRVMSIRARTPVEVLVMGKNVFTQMSGALAPLRDALAQALNRRNLDIWKDNPRMREVLQHAAVRSLMEPVPEPLLKPDMTLLEVVQAFVEQANEFFFVSKDGRAIDGVITITDLLRARSTGATGRTPLSEFMTRNPVTVAADDDCAVAAAALTEYRLKSLPVVESKQGRQLSGCIRLRRMMAFVFKELAQAQREPESSRAE
jgi:NADH dehydrogenase